MSDQMREKRRRGPVNRLRRQLYGVLLGSVSIPALAAGGQTGSGDGAMRRLPVVQTGAPWRIHNNMLLIRDPLAADGSLMAYDGMAPLLANAAAISRDFAFLPVGGVLFTAHYLGNDLDKIAKGLGVDFLVPELGYFHLNLYSGRNELNGGTRWRINPQGFALPESSQQLWSLGGSLALEPSGPNGHRQLTFVPQLVMNLNCVARLSGRVQAVFSYHNWHNQLDRGLPNTGPVPQMSLKWTF